MMAQLFSSAHWLEAKNNPGFGSLPIPQVRDSEISALLRTWTALNESARSAAAREIMEEHRFTLLAYSERMASLAVRLDDQELVFLGLLALGIDGWRGDWRDNATIICLHYDAAQRLGTMPETVFEKAAALLPIKAATALRSFLRRSASDRTLQAMGYVAGIDSDGFRYRRTW